MTRLEEESTREKVRETVRSFPGIHTRALARQLNTSLALAQYHLQALEEAREVKSVQVGGFRRYFPAKAFGALTASEKKVLNILRREKPLEIVLALLEFGRLHHGELSEALGWSKPTLTYHLEKLVEAGLVLREPKGETRGFSLKDPDGVRSLLTQFQPVAEVDARVHDTWEDLFSGHRRKK